MISVTHSSSEHRFLTVLFCDMVGSTDYQFRMPPEEFEALLADYRQAVFELVERHGGHVARVIGDGILAFFGWPRATGHDAEAAVTCALQIGRRLQTRPFGPPDRPAAARVGIETGWVLVGEIGPSGRAERDGVIGPAPNIAARLQTLARPNGVVAGQAALAQLSPRFLTEPVDVAALGLPVAHTAAHVVGLSDRDDPLARLRLARRTPLIGRTEELAWVRAGWERMAGGPGQVLLITGEPGIGKSRLLVAAIEALPVTDAAVTVLFCAKQWIDSPFQALIEPLARDIGLAGETADADAWEREALERVGAFAGTLDAHLEQTSAALAGLLGCRPARDVAPADMRSWTLRALAAWLDAKLARGRLVLVVEDAHWADASLGAFLRQLCGPEAPAGLLLLLTCHSGAEPDWLRDLSPLLARLDLRRLPPEQAGDLTTAMLPNHAASVIAEIVQRAEGVPLFLEELARSQALADGHGGRLPGSISQLLAARLDSVGAARGIAQLAGVFGREVPSDLLRPLSGLAEDAFERGVEQLVDSGIMERQGLGRACVLSFRHGMFGDAAYQALPSATRRRLHGQVADQLRHSQPSWTRAAPEVLGHHLEQAGEPAEAARLFCRAATNSLAGGAYPEAVSNARRAIQLAQSRDPGQQRTLLAAHIALGEALIATQGESSTQVHGVYENATKLALDLNAPKDLLSPLRGMCAFYQTRGPLHRARELITWLLQLAQRDQDPLLIADAERRLGWCLLCQGELVSARPLLDSSVRRFVAAGSRSHAVLPIDTDILGLANRGILSWLADGDAEARRRAAEVMRRAEASRNPLARAYGFGCAAIIFQLAGDVAGVGHAAARARDVATAHNIPYWLSVARILSGWAEVFGASPSRASDEFRVGLDHYELVEGRILKPYALMLLAQISAAAGDDPGAEAALAEAEAVAVGIGATMFLPMLAATRATLPGFAARPDARRLIEAAIAEATAQGSGALAGRLRALAGRLSAGCG